MKLHFAFLVVLLGLPKAWAFPDLVRHNYTNCNSCHVSPTGGGVLNPYGRSMSKELLATWSTEREPEFLYGVLGAEQSENWLFGGDYRSVYVERVSPESKRSDTITMQAGVDVGSTSGPLTWVMTLGQYNVKEKKIEGHSPQFYGLWNFREEWSLKVGRFTPAFGIKHPYHTLPTRQALGLGVQQERNTGEVMWSGELWNWSLSAGETPLGRSFTEKESLVTTQIQRTFAESYKVG